MGRLARELGLARFGKLSIDGTKVRANASKRKAMSDGRMAKEERRLRGEIEARLAAAGAADAAEDARLGADVRGDELPAELRRREDRLAAIRAAKSRLEAQQRAADDARGRQPDQDRNPKGGQPYKRSYGTLPTLTCARKPSIRGSLAFSTVWGFSRAFCQRRPVATVSSPPVVRFRQGFSVPLPSSCSSR